MMNWGKIGAALLATALMAGGAYAAPQSEVEGPAVVDLNGSDWVVKSEDNVCGVSQARQITNPAKVDYEELMSATVEMKELKREGIKRDSARGQALVTKARDKVRRASKAVMNEKGHCSVWKKITHRKGTAVTDLTRAIKKKLGS